MSTSVEHQTRGTEHQHRLRYGGRSRKPTDRCERPNVMVCLDCEETVQTLCNRSSRTACEPCGKRYHGRVARIFASGWQDTGGQVLMLTLTAPGDQQHSMPSGDVCPCTPIGGTNLAAWNATAGQRWTHLLLYLRRRYGDGLQYGKGHELQKRGAIHYHVLIRVPAKTAATMLREKKKIRAMAIERGFGHEVDLVATRSEGAGVYAAKYVSKACDQRDSMPWMDLTTGEILDGAPRFRPWSTSRRWGSTMKQQRASERLWAMLHATPGGDDVERSESAPPLDSLPAIYTPKNEKANKEAGKSA